MTIQVNIAEAKTQFSKLLARALRGERVVICHHNRPVAELTPVAVPRRRKRRLGFAPGIVIHPSFFDDQWIADLFEGKGNEDADPLTRGPRA